MQTEVYAAKQKYIKKLSELERMLDKTRQEKRELMQQNENQRLVFKS